MNVMRTDLLDHAGPPAAGLSEPRREIMRLLRMLRRNWILIAGAATAALVLGFVFLGIVEPTYRSTVRILLDQSRAGEVPEAASLPQGNNVDEYIATQVAIFQSDVIVRRVAGGLGVDGAGHLQRLPQGPAVPPPAADARADEDALKPVFDALRRTISVYRLDRSFVVEVAVNSPDPAMSRHVADAVGNAYIVDQGESYSQSLTQAGDWLEERIEDLRRQSLEAAEAVEAFRTRSGIRATDGQLISDQQLTGLSNQFVLAEANVARLQSRFGTYRTAIEGNDLVTLAGLLSGGGEGEAQSASATDYLTALERARSVLEGFGADNSQLPAIRAEAERLGRLVLVESRSRLASYSNELDAARAQLSGLEESMQLAAARSETSNLPLVQLRSLDQRANSLQTLYQTYLQRYQETLQRQSLPVNAARIISYAEEPGRPVFPNTAIVLAFALVAGLGLGTAMAIGREFFDGSIRTADDLKRLGLEPIGQALRMRGAPRPGSAAEESLMRLRRSLLSALRPTRGPNCAAFVSALPGEGRSFMTDLLASTLVEEGRKVVIVDLSGGPAPAQRSAAQRWLPFALPRLSFLSRPPERAFVAPRGSKVERVVGSFADLRATGLGAAGWGGPGDLALYDFVLLDLPALDSAAELRTVAEAVDTLVVLVEWGRTDSEAVRDILSSGPVFQRKIAGAVLTKVNRRKRALYEARHVGRAS